MLSVFVPALTIISHQDKHSSSLESNVFAASKGCEKLEKQ